MRLPTMTALSRIPQQYHLVLRNHVVSKIRYADMMVGFIWVGLVLPAGVRDIMDMSASWGIDVLNYENDKRRT